jgi:YebC/PmpR family DNA-binding regulatory protein
MPKDNIERAIKKGTGELEGVNYYEITYEAYGPGGVAILINVLTDNKNRTAAEIRNLLSKGNGNLGETGCVSYLFSRKGLIVYDASKYSEDEIISVALDAGADYVAQDDDTIEVLTEPDDFVSVLEALQKADYHEENSEVTMIPESTITLDPETTKKVLNLIDNLDDHDDVQSIATNLDIPADFTFDDE